MEASNLTDPGPNHFQPSNQILSTAIVQAVWEVISHATGKALPIGLQECIEPEIEAEPAQVALAVAYANLCVEDPDMVTSSHLKMLRSNFSFEQIQELNQLIKKIIEQGK
ncbi:hypothetical protein [Nafulsella turpanensis]|uniref:hypothetical protein n=1 Tax=Nafulsella turpanensis TaxID=1265690 RepID=UPI000347E0AB|nr:hypothetical protein [Nafulsella turpanensis]